MNLMRETLSLSKAIDLGLLNVVESFVFDETSDSQLSWSYCLSYDEIEFLPYRGGELIFLDEKKDAPDLIDCIELLESNNVNSLCLREYNRHQGVIERAEEYGFNLFFFDDATDFYEESLKINKYLIELDGEFYFKSNRFLECLERLEKSSGIPEFIKYTSIYLQLGVTYWHILSKPLSYGSLMAGQERPLSEEELLISDGVKEYEIIDRGDHIFMKIPFLTERYAYVIFDKKGSFNRFEKHILKRFTNFLKPIVTERFVRQIQKEHFLDTSWATGWFSGSLTRSSVVHHLNSLGITGEFKMLCVVCCSIPVEAKATVNYGEGFSDKNRVKNDVTIQISANIFRPFKARGFKTITLLEDNILKFVILTPSDLEDYERKFVEATRALERRKDITEEYSGIRICYGRKVYDIEDISWSHDSAMYLLNMGLVKDVRVMRFEDYYQLGPLEELRRGELLGSYIRDTLKELLDAGNETLLKTLRIYFECGFSKQRTMEIMKVSRQTVYTRLERIGELLGYDFETGHKRLGIELSLMALNYLEFDKMSTR